MASTIMMTAATQFPGGSPAAGKLTPTTTRRGGVMAVKAAATKGPSSAEMVAREEMNSSSKVDTRRGLMFASLAMAAATVAKAAMADEPKRGSEEAKKKYAPICVTMPTARICRY